MNGFRVRRDVIDGVDAVLADSTHRFPRHAHDQFGVGLILDGAQSSASGRGTVEAQAGDVITVNPGEVHDGAPIGARGRRWSMLYLAPWRIADAGRESGCRAEEFAEPVVADRRAAVAVARLISAITATSGAALDLAREERELQVLARLLAPEGEREGGTASGVRQAISLIDDDPTAPVSLADLAGVSGLSRFQVVRGVRRATGLTPHAYLLRRRLELARRDIRAGQSLAETALACGFADQSHMTRLFKRQFGYPPGAFAAG